MGHYANLCRSCGSCDRICPAGAQHSTPGGHTFNAALCRACGKCAEICPGNAMKLYGKTVTVEEALALALEDRDFYEESGGGVTVSGGEPLIQKDFTLALLKAVRDEKIHTALDTCAFVPRSAIEEALEVTDMFLVDFKHADAEAHRRLTGQSNEVIKNNLLFLSGKGAKIEIRIPFVPGCNDSDENMEQTGAFLGKLNITAVKLLPYHALARNKYAALQMPDTMPDAESPSEERIAQAAEILKSYGLNARSGRA